MPFDYNHQSTNANPGSTPRPEGARATGADQQQEAPARENPEPLGSGAYPGAVPSFFPYTQYPGLTWQPRVDIFEDHDSFLVIVEVPGVNPEQLNVENTSNLLLISGQSLPVMSSGSENMIRCYQERLCGGFTRSIQLPPHADVDRAKATCKNGLLEIEVPKRQPSPGPTGSAVGAEQQTETKATKRRSGQPGVKH
ncbi:MAG: Hsp20/alpha crystallin family protein [Thermacetogeniaceae bacterium]|jgi:HSP20 family molecular chaperone IbpA